MMIYKNIKNLFVVSHLGQLSKVECLIQEKKLKDNMLIVLYTHFDLTMPSVIDNHYNKKYFTCVEQLKLPTRPNKINIKKLSSMKDKYHQLIDKLNLYNLYVLSFEGHYNLLLDYASTQNIILHLIEEGTAIYKEDRQSYNYSKKEKLHYLLIKYSPFFKDLKVSLKRYRKFDNIYVSFPKLIRDKFDAKNIEYFFSYEKVSIEEEKNINKVIEKYSISSSDMVYVNQRYNIDESLFVETVISALLVFNQKFKGRVFIKMHPKDNDSLVQLFQKKIFMLNIEKEIILIKDKYFLVEPIIMTVRPKAVIGLTSTVLLYVHKIDKNIKAYSIALLLINTIEDSEVKRLILEHFKILNKFQCVVNIENKKDIRL